MACSPPPLLPPKPPPTNGVMTRTFSFANPIACAIAAWFGNGVCVEFHTVIVPFSSRASAVCVSMGACAP